MLRLTLGLLVAAVPAAALAQSPPPNATTATASPTHAADGYAFTLTGTSDCADMNGHLVYRQYDGTMADSVARGSGHFDDAAQKYRYSIRMVVPEDAAPAGDAAYAEPFCGPPDEYPKSNTVDFTVDRGRLALAASPARVTQGRTVRLTGADCDGNASGHVEVLVRYAGGATARLTVPIVRRGFAGSLQVDPAAAPGRAVVGLANPARDCPASRPATTFFTVRFARPATATPTPTPTATATVRPSETASPTPSPSATAPAPRPAADSDGSLLVVAFVVGGLSLAGAGAATYVVLRQRRRP